MSKRFTETNKWIDSWFIELDNTQKLLWLYVLDNCSISGVFDVSYKMLNFNLSSNKIDMDFINKALGKRIHWLKDNKFIVKDFIKYQYKNGELNENYNPHKAVLKDLEKNNLTLSQVLTKTYETLNEELQDKDKDKDKDKVKGKDKVKHKYGNFKKVLLTDKEYSKLIEELGESKTKNMIERVDGYVASTGKPYKSHYATILNWHRKDNEKQKYIKQEPLSSVAHFDTNYEEVN